jgi:hypothetical protein
LLPFLVSFALEYAVKKVEENGDGLEHTSFWSVLVMLLY